MSTARIVPSGVHAIFAADPGGTSGIAAGYVELRPTLKETLTTLRSRKSVEVTGDWLTQARTIEAMMTRFVFTANVESLLPLYHIHLVFEDFVLRMPADTTNLTSIWVAAAAVALFKRDDLDLAWQQASKAKSFATDERLRRWGLWEVGSAHKRDAWRHFAARLNDILA